jgi:hypothetical protein
VSDLLGLLVLTSPLWLIVVFLVVGIFIAFKVAKRFRSTGAKLAIGFGVVVLVLIAPFADGIAGRLYLNHLCVNEAEVKVYRTVELPAEHWERGKPRYLRESGIVDMRYLPEQFEWRKSSEPYVDFFIKIEKWRWQLVDKETQTVLGERITYMRRFGWINHFSTAPGIGESCRNLRAGLSQDELIRKEREQEQKFFGDIFKPITTR